MSTATLTPIPEALLPQEPVPDEYRYLTWEEPPPLAGAADVPLWFDAPERGSRPLFLRRFYVAVVDEARGLIPRVAERNLAGFLLGAREGHALVGLRKAAESLALAANTSRIGDRARGLAWRAEEYRIAAGQRPVSRQG
jgi:hypothetical protein